MCLEGNRVKIEHVAIYVSDLDRAKQFFVDYLDGRPGAGYHNPKTGLRSYFISFDGGARLELMTRPGLLVRGETPPAQTGYAHVAFSVGSRQRVDALTQRLRNAGFAVVSGPRTTGDGYYESCILDLEGNQIELTV